MYRVFDVKAWDLQFDPYGQSTITAWTGFENKAEISTEVIIENFILYIVSHYSVAMELKAIG